jgi:hypothetical protein
MQQNFQKKKTIKDTFKEAGIWLGNTKKELKMAKYIEELTLELTVQPTLFPPQIPRMTQEFRSK